MGGGATPFVPAHSLLSDERRGHFESTTDVFNKLLSRRQECSRSGFMAAADAPGGERRTVRACGSAGGAGDNSAWPPPRHALGAPRATFRPRERSAA